METISLNLSLYYPISSIVEIKKKVIERDRHDLKKQLGSFVFILLVLIKFT